MTPTIPLSGGGLEPRITDAWLERAETQMASGDLSGMFVNRDDVLAVIRECRRLRLIAALSSQPAPDAGLRAEIEARHVEVPAYRAVSAYCKYDGDKWPCDASRLLAAARATTEPGLDVERLARALGTWPGRLDVDGQRQDFVAHIAAEYGSARATTGAEPGAIDAGRLAEALCVTAALGDHEKPGTHKPYCQKHLVMAERALAFHPGDRHPMNQDYNRLAASQSTPEDER